MVCNLLARDPSSEKCSSCMVDERVLIANVFLQSFSVLVSASSPARPAEVPPRWHRGIEKGVKSPVARAALRPLYRDALLGVIELRWERVDLDAITLTFEETKTGEPLVIPIVRQLTAILERRLAERGELPEHSRGWMFPSETSASGRIMTLQQLNARIGEEGGAKFWFHVLRNCFITVTDRELMLPTSLTKRLVNHARPWNVTEGYASDWTGEQLRDAAQRIADRIDELIQGGIGRTDDIGDRTGQAALTEPDE